LNPVPFHVRRSVLISSVVSSRCRWPLAVTVAPTGMTSSVRPAAAVRVDGASTTSHSSSPALICAVACGPAKQGRVHPQCVAGHDRGERAENHPHPDREVDDVENAERQREADADGDVPTTDENAPDKRLRQFGHGILSAEAVRAPGAYPGRRFVNNRSIVLGPGASRPSRATSSQPRAASTVAAPRPRARACPSAV
jgi:hypothetical protein